MNTTQITNRIIRYAEEMGLDVSVDKSNVSESKYLTIESTYKIRISNHALPFVYNIGNNSPDLFVGEQNFTWQDAVVRIAEQFNVKLPASFVSYQKRVQTIADKKTKQFQNDTNKIKNNQIDALMNSTESDWIVESSKRSKWFRYQSHSVCGNKSMTWQEARDQRIKELIK